MHARKLHEILKNSLRRVLGPSLYDRLYYWDKGRQATFHILRSGLSRLWITRFLGRKSMLRQRPVSWTILSTGFSTYQEFALSLQRHAVRFQEGGWTLYIPPQRGLEEILGEMVAFYPPDAGYKILKNFASPMNARYIPTTDKRIAWEEVTLLGTPADQLHAAAVAEITGLGPRVYDLTELRAGATMMTAFVVRHVQGGILSPADGEAFREKLQAVVTAGALKTAVPWGDDPHDDFRLPDFNRNLLKDEAGNLLYVDFQQFVVAEPRSLIDSILANGNDTLAFGKRYLLRKKSTYVYQSIPNSRIAGKRDSIIRWNRIKRILQQGSLTVDRRLILDVCCNAGIMSAMALSDGALWAIAWDLPPVAQIAAKLLRAMGITRADIIGKTLRRDTDLHSDIPSRFERYLDEAIVFYLAAWNSVGLIRDIAAMPWRALVFEGHERQTAEGLKDVIAIIENECRCKLAAEGRYRDGDTEARPLFLFARAS